MVTRYNTHHVLQTSKLIIILFLLPLLGSAIFALPAYLWHKNSPLLPLLIYLGEFFASLYLICRYYNLAQCGLSVPKPSGFIWALLFLLVRSITWLAILPVKVNYPELSVVVSNLIFFVLINATAEEVHFRGLLYSVLQAKVSDSKLAAFISSVLFGLLHLSLGEPSWIPLFITDSLAWCAIRLGTGSVYPSILSHGLQNLLFTTFLIVPQNLSSQTEIIYTITAMIVDLLFFTILVYKHPDKPKTRRCKI